LTVSGDHVIIDIDKDVKGFPEHVRVPPRLLGCYQFLWSAFDLKRIEPQHKKISQLLQKTGVADYCIFCASGFIQ
jgi:hypothetical protein